MTILQLTTVHPRNDTRISVKQCPSLKSKLGQPVVLMVADGKGDDDREGVRIVDVGQLRFGRIGRAIIGSWLAFNAVMCIKPKLVHFHDPELIPLGFIFKLAGLKVIYDVHENVPQTILKREWIPRGLRKNISVCMAGVEKFAGKVFDRVVTATPTIGKRFPRNKTVLVQNFPITKELVLANGTPYDERPLEFAYVGGITRVRAALEMVAALNKLNSEKGVKLHMAGNFRPLVLEKEVKKIVGWQAVVFHGWASRDEMVQILGRSRAGLVLCHPVPNFIDSQPVKLYEYMSAGIPVIASDFPMWRNIVEGAECGLLVDPQDPDAIADAMKWILEHPETAKQMGENGKRAVENLYNWEIEAKKLVSMYDELLLGDNNRVYRKG